MTKDNFKILFVQGMNRTNIKNETPIYCRITFNKNRKQFSTGIFVESVYWNSKSQLVSKSYTSAISINSKLDKIKSKLNQIFTILILQEKTFTVEDIYDIYLGKETKKKESIVNYFNLYLDRIKQLIGIEIKENTYVKFVYVKNHLISFIKWKYKKTEFPLEDLSLQFLEDFEYYLKITKGQKQVTINKTIQRVRTPIKLAISEGYIDRDPFVLYKAKSVRKTVVFLTQEELYKIENTIINQKRLVIVRDLFVFCCYTGLAFNEMNTLELKHIESKYDGFNWIKMKREKTQREISIPILPKAFDIINKYSSNESKIFPIISNQKFNSYLKEVSEIVGIEKKISHHTARKTFASTVLLFNDVPMEIVSELLGHSKISTTQDYYAKIVNKKLSEQMKRLSLKLISKKKCNDVE
jgi:integrase/recombinase XerD